MSLAIDVMSTVVRNSPSTVIGTTPMTDPLAVPIPEAARLSGCGRSTMYAEIALGRLRIRKVGRRTIIAMEDLRSWLDSKTVEGK